jgi:hypothetical protein
VSEKIKRFLISISLFSLVVVYSIILISCEPPQSKEAATPEEQLLEETTPANDSYYKLDYITIRL